MDSQGNATPGQNRTTTLHGTFSGGPDGEMILVDPAQPKLDERVRFIGGKTAHITISDGVNSFYYDARVVNPQAFEGITPLPASGAPATQLPVVNQPPAGNQPPSGNLPVVGGSGLVGLLGGLGLAAGAIGAILVALGLIALLIDRSKGGKLPSKPTGPKPPPPEPPQIRYILQANASSLEVHPQEELPVYFQASAHPARRRARSCS